MQQDRGGDCGHAARCADLGDAGDLFCRIPVRLLDFASASAAQRVHFRQFRTARLRALACVFAGYLAYVLARVCWFALPCHSFGDHCLFSHALADQPRPNAAEKSMKVERFLRSDVVVSCGRSARSAVRCMATSWDEPSIQRRLEAFSTR